MNDKIKTLFKLIDEKVDKYLSNLDIEHRKLSMDTLRHLLMEKVRSVIVEMLTPGDFIQPALRLGIETLKDDDLVTELWQEYITAGNHLKDAKRPMYLSYEELDKVNICKKLAAEGIANIHAMEKEMLRRNMDARKLILSTLENTIRRDVNYGIARMRKEIIRSRRMLKLIILRDNSVCTLNADLLPRLSPPIEHEIKILTRIGWSASQKNFTLTERFKSNVANYLHVSGLVSALEVLVTEQLVDVVTKPLQVILDIMPNVGDALFISKTHPISALINWDSKIIKTIADGKFKMEGDERWYEFSDFTLLPSYFVEGDARAFLVTR